MFGRFIWSHDDSVDAGDADLVPGLTIPPLAPGQDWSQDFAVVLPAGVTGDKFLALVADRYGRVVETSKADNTSIELIKVYRAADAYEENDDMASAYYLGGLVGNRTLQGLNIAHHEDPDWFRFRLSNTGTAQDVITVQLFDKSGKASLRLYDGDRTLLVSGGGDAAGFASAGLVGLAAGEYYLEVSSVDYKDFAYDLVISSAARTGADLNVSDLTLDAPDLVPGGSVTARVTVTNSGTETARNFLLSVTLDKDGVLYDVADDVLVAVLSPGQEKTFNVTVTVPGDLVGTDAVLRASVDAQSVVTEINETDNSLEKDVHITGAADGDEAAETAQGSVELGTVRGTSTVTGRTLHSLYDVDTFHLRTIADGTGGRVHQREFRCGGR